MATRVLYLIRHGHHDLEDPHKDDLGGGLTSIGVEQAELAAQRSGQAENISVQRRNRRVVNSRQPYSWFWIPNEHPASGRGLVRRKAR